MSERKLSTVQIISEIKSIEGADNIELAVVKGWQCVVKKDQFKVGDKVIYCEIDSFLPIKECYEFLRKSSYKKMGSEEGFRLKTIRLRGQISQGLLLPIEDNMKLLEVGVDVTEQLGIKIYEPPIPAELAGIARGNFPSFIPKTDEERIQNCYEDIKEHLNKKWYATEKLDGSSVTFYFKNDHFGVCSRNLELEESETNTLWKVAKQLKLHEKLKEFGNIALQGEIVGEGIQGNPYKIKGQKVYFFTAYDIDKGERATLYNLQLICNVLNLEEVPEFYRLGGAEDYTIDFFLGLAEQHRSMLCDTPIEGLVFRLVEDPRISFKVISNKWLLKNE